MKTDQLLFKLPNILEVEPILEKLDKYSTFFGFRVLSNREFFIKIDIEDIFPKYLCQHCIYGNNYTQRINKILRSRRNLRLEKINKFLSSVEQYSNKTYITFSEDELVGLRDTGRLYYSSNQTVYLKLSNDNQFIDLKDIFDLESAKESLKYNYIYPLNIELPLSDKFVSYKSELNIDDIDSITLEDYLVILDLYIDGYLTLSDVCKIPDLEEELERDKKDYIKRLHALDKDLKEIYTQDDICSILDYKYKTVCKFTESDLPIKKRFVSGYINGIDYEDPVLLRKINLKNYIFGKVISPIHKPFRTKLLLGVDDAAVTIDTNELLADNNICWGTADIDNYTDMNSILEGYLNLNFSMEEESSKDFLYQIDDNYTFSSLGSDLNEVYLEQYKGEETYFNIRNKIPTYKDSKLYGFLVSFSNYKVEIVYEDANGKFVDR